MYFSMVRSPNRVLTPLKSASFEIRISSFVNPSKIVVWPRLGKNKLVLFFDNRHFGPISKSVNLALVDDGCRRDSSLQV
jgi:hypothetical protein